MRSKNQKKKDLVLSESGSDAAAKQKTLQVVKEVSAELDKLNIPRESEGVGSRSTSYDEQQAARLTIVAEQVSAVKIAMREHRQGLRTKQDLGNIIGKMNDSLMSIDLDERVWLRKPYQEFVLSREKYLEAIESYYLLPKASSIKTDPVLIAIEGSEIRSPEFKSVEIWGGRLRKLILAQATRLRLRKGGERVVLGFLDELGRRAPDVVGRLLLEMKDERTDAALMELNALLAECKLDDLGSDLAAISDKQLRDAKRGLSLGFHPDTEPQTRFDPILKRELEQKFDRAMGLWEVVKKLVERERG